MISAGKMRTTITIEKPASTRGTLGQTVWETFATARAEIRAITGRGAGHQLNISQLGGSENYFQVFTRHIPGVKANMRITFDGRVFVILYPIRQTEGNARQWEIICKEVMTA